MFDNKIQLNWIFSKNQAFKNSSSAIWKHFDYLFCVSGRLCEYKFDNSIFMIILHVYINFVPYYFNYNLKSDTLGPVIDFNFNHQI